MEALVHYCGGHNHRRGANLSNKIRAATKLANGLFGGRFERIERSVKLAAEENDPLPEMMFLEFWAFSLKSGDFSFKVCHSFFFRLLRHRGVYSAERHAPCRTTEASIPIASGL